MNGQQAPAEGLAADPQTPAQGISSSTYQAQSHFLPEAASADDATDGVTANASATKAPSHAFAHDVPATGESGELYVALVNSDASPSLARNDHKLLSFRKGDYLLSTQIIGEWHWGHVRGKDAPDDYGYFHPNSVRKAVQVSLKASDDDENEGKKEEDAKPVAVKTEDDSDHVKPLPKDVPVKKEEAAEQNSSPSCCQMISFDRDTDAWKARLRFPSGEVDDDAVISAVFGKASGDKKNPEHVCLEEEYGCYIDLPSVIKEGSDERRYAGEVYVRSKNQRIIERAGDGVAKRLDEAVASHLQNDPTTLNAAVGNSPSSHRINDSVEAHVSDVEFNPKHRSWSTMISFPNLDEKTSDVLIRSVFGPATKQVTQSLQRTALENQFGCAVLPFARRKRSGWHYTSVLLAAADKSKVNAAMPQLLEMLKEGNEKDESEETLKWIPPHANSKGGIFTEGPNLVVPDQFWEIGPIQTYRSRWYAQLVVSHPLVDKTSCVSAVFGDVSGEGKPRNQISLEEEYSCEILVKYFSNGRTLESITIICMGESAINYATKKIVGLLNTNARSFRPLDVCRPQKVGNKNGRYGQTILVRAGAFSLRVMEAALGVHTSSTKTEKTKEIERRFRCSIEITTSNTSIRISCHHQQRCQSAAECIMESLETAAIDILQVKKLWSTLEGKKRNRNSVEESFLSSPKRLRSPGKSLVVVGSPDSQPDNTQGQKRCINYTECGSFAEGIDGDIAAGSSKKPRLSPKALPGFSTPSSSILPSNLVPVSPDLARSARFPIGCHVMHHSGDTIVPGTVAAVYIKLESPGLVAGSSYDVCYGIGKLGSTNAFAPEKELQFASRCPVSVDPSFVPEGQMVSRDPDGWIPGEVISSFTGVGDVSESYMMTLLGGAGKVSGIPRDMIRYRGRLSSLEQGRSKQASLSNVRDDASTASAFGSMSSSFVGSAATDSSATVTQRLVIPSEIEIDAIKKYLYGNGGSIATKMSEKLGISISVVGPGLGEEKDSPSGVRQSPCVVLNGSLNRVSRASKVIEHILVEKCYNGNNKSALKDSLCWLSSDIERSSSSPTQNPPTNEASEVQAGRKDDTNDAEEGEIFDDCAAVEENNSTEYDDLPEKPANFEDVASAINVIIMEKGPLLVGQVNTQFRQKYGCPIDYRSLGYDKLKDLILAVPHVYLKTTTRNDNGRAEIYVHSQFKRIIKNVLDLFAENSPIALKDLKPMYRERYRSGLDHEKIGFKKLKDFVETFPCLRMRVTGKNTIMIFLEKSED